MNIIYFAGGCFWGVEKHFSLIRGVVATEVGYANGHVASPSYQQVCAGDTGHAETVKVEYDPARVSLEKLLALYARVIDPTSVDRQGADAGPQYRTGVYYITEEDGSIIRRFLVSLQERFAAPIAVECAPLKAFYNAEEYHQNYLEKNPTGYCHIGPSAFLEAREA